MQNIPEKYIDLPYTRQLNAYVLNEDRVKEISNSVDDTFTALSLEQYIMNYLPNKVIVRNYGVEISQWVIDNLNGIWAYDVNFQFDLIYYFREESDTILFKLRWG